MTDNKGRMAAETSGAGIEICKRLSEAPRVEPISSPEQRQGCSGEQLCRSSGSGTWVQVQVFLTCYLHDYKQVSKILLLQVRNLRLN